MPDKLHCQRQYDKGALGFDFFERASVASRGLNWLASLIIRFKKLNANEELALAA
jgi:capsid protein